MIDLSPTFGNRYREVVYSADFALMAPSLFDEEALRRLEFAFATSRLIGDVIPGAGGVRKVRVALIGRGKRSGARVIYFDHRKCERVHLLFAYAKSSQVDMTEGQTRAARALVERIKREGC